jgi:hypothetical protein
MSRTRAQITAARRAAHHLVARLGSCRVVPVPAGEAAPEVNHIVLVRSDARLSLIDYAMLRPAATSIEVNQLSADQAGYFAARLRAAVADLTWLLRSLERHAERR